MEKKMLNESMTQHVRKPIQEEHKKQKGFSMTGRERSAKPTQPIKK